MWCNIIKYPLNYVPNYSKPYLLKSYVHGSSQSQKKKKNCPHLNEETTREEVTLQSLLGDSHHNLVKH